MSIYIFIFQLNDSFSINFFLKKMENQRVVRKATFKRDEKFQAEFEHEFLTTTEGRKAYLDVITEPKFVKAVNEFCSAFIPYHCEKCKEIKQEAYRALTKEEKWIPNDNLTEKDYICYFCGVDTELLYKNSMFCHLRCCKMCFE
jgi:hypothetical protein